MNLANIDIMKLSSFSITFNGFHSTKVKVIGGTPVGENNIAHNVYKFNKDCNYEEINDFLKRICVELDIAIKNEESKEVLRG